MRIFRRIGLVENLVGKLLKPAATSASASGVFLTAPQGTGKSTFVREDLRPALEAAGATVIYANLRDDQLKDPGDVIVSAIEAELAGREGIIAWSDARSCMDTVPVKGLSCSRTSLGLSKGMSLSAALSALSDESRQIILLVLDEAQHAMTSEAGIDALFALKAAHNELNSRERHGLRIVATGSNRDKLAMLRDSQDQAFFGSPLVALPPLGPDHIDWLIESLGFANQLETAVVYEWFRLASFRPKVLGAALDALVNDPHIGPAQYVTRLEELVFDRIEASNIDALRVLHSLMPLHAAVLRVAASAGTNFAPFEHATMEHYRTVLAAMVPAQKVEPDLGSVQQALNALQEQALVWRSARGVYAVEDTFLSELMKKADLTQAG